MDIKRQFVTSILSLQLSEISGVPLENLEFAKVGKLFLMLLGFTFTLALFHST